MLVLFVIVGLQQVAHADEMKATIEATPRTATIDSMSCFINQLR